MWMCKEKLLQFLNGTRQSKHFFACMIAWKIRGVLWISFSMVLFWCFPKLSERCFLIGKYSKVFLFYYYYYYYFYSNNLLFRIREVSVCFEKIKLMYYFKRRTFVFREYNLWTISNFNLILRIRSRKIIELSKFYSLKTIVHLLNSK
jgi:hypothetical protein